MPHYTVCCHTAVDFEFRRAGGTGSEKGKEAVGRGEKNLWEKSPNCPQVVAVRKGEAQFSPKMRRHTVPPLVRYYAWIMVGFLLSPHLLFITPCSDAGVLEEDKYGRRNLQKLS